MASAALLPFGILQFCDANGDPLVGGTVGYYQPNSPGTLKTVWVDENQTVVATNPVPLDSAGRFFTGGAEAGIYGSGQYNMIVRDASGNIQFSALTRAITDATAFDINSPQVLRNIAALRALNNATLPTNAAALVEGYNAPGDGGGGIFTFQNTDTTSTDNGGTLIVDTAGNRWQRQYDGPSSVLHWGADPTGVLDSTTEIAAALANELAVHFPLQPTGAAASYKINAALTLRPGHTISFDGWGVSLSQSTAATAIFQLVESALTFGNIRISGGQLTATAANAIGVKTTLVSGLVCQDLLFTGLAGGNLVCDRGYKFNILTCESRPTASFQAGNFQFLSTDNANVIFYPTLRDCRVNTANEMGTTLGTVSPCVLFQHVVGGMIDNFVAERLDSPTPAAVDGIVMKGNCQGCKILGGVTYGANFGVSCQAFAGAAPGYIDIIGHDVDFFSAGAISVAPTGGPVCADITIVGGKLTAGQTAPCRYIDLANALKINITGVIMDDYTSSHIGTGIAIDSISSCSIQGCAMAFLANGISLVSAPNLLYVNDNVISDCTNPLTGAAFLDGTVSRFSGNAFITPGSLNISTPAVPASGTPIFNNKGCDVTIYIDGGTGVNASIGPSNLGAITNQPLVVSANNSVSLSYATPPTWVWVSMT